MPMPAGGAIAVELMDCQSGDAVPGFTLRRLRPDVAATAWTRW